MTAETLRTEVARAALYEVGQDELGLLIEENSAGNPSLPWWLLGRVPSSAEMTACVRAQRLGHLADPDGAPVGCDLPDEHVVMFACDPFAPCPRHVDGWARWRAAVASEALRGGPPGWDQHKRECSTCGGERTHQMSDAMTCPRCNGTGEEP